MNKNYKIKVSKITKPFQNVKKEIIIIESLIRILLDSIRESESFQENAIENISIVLYDRVEALNKKIKIIETILNIKKYI